MSLCCSSKTVWEMMLGEHLEDTHEMIDSETLNGIHVVAFLRKGLLKHLSVISKNQIKMGLNGMAGNKGAVSTT